MSVECIAFKPYSSGTLMGFAHLWVPKMGLIIYGFSLHAKDGKRWINMPAKEYVDKESGEKKYQPILKFKESSHFDAFSRLALDAIDDYCADKGCTETEYMRSVDDDEEK